MKSEFVLEADGVTKKYKSYRTQMHKMISLLLKRDIGVVNEFSAVSDLSIKLEHGKTLGVIGSNGSGKSTFLKMICSVVKPDCGSIHVFGRLAAILELGTGFNPEFTGTENVEFYLRLIGVAESKLNETKEEIYNFASLGDHIYSPLKTYSSGMFVRLAFATITSVKPDILIVDEALAVGDIAFQAKCMARINKLKSSGVSIIFVSHDIATVRNLCDEVLWIENGKQKLYSDARTVCDSYIKEYHEKQNEDISNLPAVKSITNKAFSSFSESHSRFGTAEVVALDGYITNIHGEPIAQIGFLEEFVIKYTVHCKNDTKDVVFGFAVTDFKGNRLFGGLSTHCDRNSIHDLSAGEIYNVAIRTKNPLKHGKYSITLAIERVIDLNKIHESIDVVSDAIQFESRCPENAEKVIHSMFWNDFMINVERGQ